MLNSYLTLLGIVIAFSIIMITIAFLFGETFLCYQMEEYQQNNLNTNWMAYLYYAVLLPLCYIGVGFAPGYLFILSAFLNIMWLYAFKKTKFAWIIMFAINA